MSDGNKRIPASELTAYERWELPTIGEDDNQALMRARAATKKAVKPLTADDIEKIRQEAYQAGFEEGKQAGCEQGQKEGHAAGLKTGQEEGFQKGLKDGQVSIDQTVAQLRQVLTNLTSPIEEQGHLVEQAMLNLTLAIARAVIHRELKIESSQITETIRKALQDLPDFANGVKIHLNPSDMDYVQAAFKDLKGSVDLLPDPSMQAGGCKIDTSRQLIDYTIEKRFQKTVHAMLFEATKLGSAATPLETSTSIQELSDYSADTLNEADQALADTESHNKPESDEAEAETETRKDQQPDATGGESDEPV